MWKKQCFKCEKFKNGSEFLEKTHMFCEDCFKKTHRSSFDPYARIIKTVEQMKFLKEVRRSAIMCWEINLIRFEKSECSKEDLFNYLESVNLIDESVLRDPQYDYAQRKEMYD